MIKTYSKKRVILSSIGLVLGLSLLLGWELVGRELVQSEIVIVAKNEIKEGAVITEKMLEEKAFKKDTVLKGSVLPKNKEKIIGKVARKDMLKGEQINEKYLSSERNNIKTGSSIYKIPLDWISSLSSSVRAGDNIIIYGQKGDKIGEYEVAFVKDMEGNEVMSMDKEEDTLDRKSGTGVIYSIEIIAPFSEYNLLRERAENKEKFVIAQIF